MVIGRIGANRRAWCALALLLAGLIVVGRSPSAAEPDIPVAAPESVGMSAKRLERVKGFIQQYVDTNQIAGAVTLIARKGKVVHFEAQGWRDKEANQPMTKDTIFTLMSMTKPIVSTALMMLWEDGKFMLDDPISNWLPSYANKQVLLENGQLVKAVRPITVRHVLTHTSGLSLNPPNPGGRGAGPGQGGGQQRPPTLGEAIDRAAPYPIAFQPGERWQYGSSTDYVAILVEKISGLSLDVFLRTRIFEPLGMGDTFYNVPREKVGRVAAAYSFDAQGKMSLFRKPEFREPTRYFQGVAGLNGTASDYFKFAQMLLNGGQYNGQRMLGRMTVDMMFSNHIGTGKPVYVAGGGYGFGLGGGVLTNPAESTDALSIGTFTWSGAWGTVFWIDPVEELIPIMLIQATPYSHSRRLRPLYSVVASQAVVDSLADQKPKIRGYDTPR